MTAPAAHPPASTHALPDGRRLSWCTYGDPDGRPVLYLHGAGSSRLEAAAYDAAARDAGVRLVSVDRPGSGGSTAHPARTLLSHAADTLHLLDALGTGPVVATGASGGSMHALAVAHVGGPERVTAAVPLVPPFSFADPGYRAVGPRKTRTMARLATTIPAVPTLMFNRLFGRITDVAGLQQAVRRDNGADAEILQDTAVAQRFLDAVVGGRAQGTYRWAVEDFALVNRPFGFAPETLAVPVTVVTGAEDALRPLGLEYVRRRAAAGLPVEHLDLPGGHLATFTQTGAQAVVDELVRRLAARP